MTLFFFPIIVVSLFCLTCLVFLPLKSQVSAIAVLILVSFSLSCSLIYFVARDFTGRGIDESVLFHLRYIFNLRMVIDHGLPYCVVFIGYLALLWFGVRVVLSRVKSNSKSGKLSCCVYPLTDMCLIGFSVLTVVVHPFVWDCLSLIGRSKVSDSELARRYMAPVKITAVKPKSFVYIYAESLERTYFDPEMFPGLLPNLSRLVHEYGLSYEGIKQIPMTNWTIAGMTASQCGIPLAAFRESGSGKRSMGLRSEFVAGKSCLGDILKQHDYELNYLGGAELSFGGKGAFYKSHGFDRVEGVSAMREHYGANIPVSKWGVFDDLLLNHAFKEIRERQDAGGLYGYFLLTLDTHSPGGFPSPSCGDIQYLDGSSKLLNAVHCADILLSDFLSQLVVDKSFQNAIVILASDHLAMANDANLATKSAVRENLWVAFNVGRVGTVKKLSTTLDIAPTLLTTIGFDADYFGLGVNLSEPKGRPTLLELYGPARLDSLVASSRSILWRTESR